MASLLIRNVNYEGPALRKQLAKAQQLQQEMSRREVECQSSAADLRERYYTACKQYGIKVSAKQRNFSPEVSAATELVMSVSGRKCLSRAASPGQRFTSSSREGWRGRGKVREAHPTLHCLHWICLWMVSVPSKRSLVHKPYFFRTVGDCWLLLHYSGFIRHTTFQ